MIDLKARPSGPPPKETRGFGFWCWDEAPLQEQKAVHAGMYTPISAQMSRSGARNGCFSHGFSSNRRDVSLRTHPSLKARLSSAFDLELLGSPQKESPKWVTIFRIIYQLSLNHNASSDIKAQNRPSQSTPPRHVLIQGPPSLQEEHHIIAGQITVHHRNLQGHHQLEHHPWHIISY